MKVTQAPSPFQPVVITLETPEELQHIRNILAHDRTVPSAIHPAQSSARESLHLFMVELYNEVRNP